MEIEHLLAHQAQQAKYYFNHNPFQDTWVLRTNSTGRLVFLAEFIHDNQQNPDANVRGVFCYQKKKSKLQWEEVPAISLSSLKAGEGVKLELRSQEVLDLYHHLHSRLGKPSKLEALLQSLQDLSPEEESALGDLIQWTLKNPHGPAGLVEKLKTLDAPELLDLNAAVQLAALEELQSQMLENWENDQESFWQELLSTRPVLLQLLFEFPITIAEEGAFVGGKSFDNTGGQLVDFIVQNKLTHNISLVEIKTPRAQLLQSKPYRTKVFGCSPELGGAVAQVLSYKDTLLKSFYQLNHESESEQPVHAFDPRCVVIMGHTDELTSNSRRRCFELFRAQLPSVRIVTFDEIFEQLSSLIELFKGDEISF